MAVLACMDSRVDVHRVLGLAEGDAHVIRNAGGRATDNAIRSLAISQWRLGTIEIVLRRTAATIRSSPFIPHRGSIRGFVLDLEGGRLHELPF